MSRQDRLEFAAASLGLVACLAILTPAVLGPASAIAPVFGAAQLARVPVVALAAAWFVVVVAVRSTRPHAAGLARENVATYMLIPAMVALGVVVHQVRSLPSLRAVPAATAITYLAVAVVSCSCALRELAPLAELPRRAWSDARAVPRRTWAWMAVFGAAGVTAVAFIPRPPTSRSPWASLADFEQWYSRQARREVPVAGPAAPVTVVKFHDYQCPPCRKVFEDHKPLADGYSAARASSPVAYLALDYPLDPECNAGVKTALHPLACEAAVAVRLAGRHHRDAALATWLFRHQPELSREAIVAAAREVGGVDDFDAAYAQALDGVKADVALGRRLGVRGTPTLFVNGIELGTVPRAYLEAAIAYELRRHGGFQGR